MAKVSTRGEGLFLVFLALAVVIVVTACAYNFLYTKNYTFTVEAVCDPTKRICFERACGEEDYCPPNKLTTYRQFNVSAHDFTQCSDNSCLAECESGALSCEEIMCDSVAGDTCTEPELWTP